METATNTFTQGMIMDINELDTPSNDYCITALNATVATYNGNEGAIQNEMGNIRISNAVLPGKPLGSVEYGGVIYYLVKSDDKIQIGSFPSPDYSRKDNHKMLWIYQPLKVGINKDDETIDFITDYLNYSEYNPVNMFVEPSFDGSVNLIINDGKNHPILINSGFHVQNNNTCTIIKRYNDNNTNRYNLSDEDEFKLQTSLYRNFNRLSYFIYNGTQEGGNLKVGNYVFYAVSCDKDGNESDIICESGVISVFIGEEGNPKSVQGGLENLNSYKSINLTIKNVDTAYTYIKLYYTKTTAQNNQLAETLAFKVDKLYKVDNNVCNIIFTGDETTFGISIDDLNILYFNANNAKALTINLNMLFLANVTLDNGESAEEYKFLRDTSLHIYPTVSFNKSLDISSEYKKSNDSYYNSKYIYNTTGYHDEEYYRFGIVYIRKDGSLTSVYNVLGNINLKDKYSYNTANVIEGCDIKFDQTIERFKSLNNKGVVRFNKVLESLTDIIGIQFNFDDVFKSSNLTNYKGFFFVRQKRIPTILALGYATNVCEESYLPSINIEAKWTDEKNVEHVNSDENVYLYESFVKGAFKTTPEGDYIYPKQIVNKVEQTLGISNNYRSRIFTLTDNTSAYLDRASGTGPVSEAMKQVGSPSKDLLMSATSDDFEYIPTYTNLSGITVQDKDAKQNWTCLYFALRENNSDTFWTSDENKDAIYTCVILLQVECPKELKDTPVYELDENGNDKTDKDGNKIIKEISENKNWHYSGGNEEGTVYVNISDYVNELIYFNKNDYYSGVYNKETTDKYDKVVEALWKEKKENKEGITIKKPLLKKYLYQNNGKGHYMRDILSCLTKESDLGEDNRWGFKWAVIKGGENKDKIEENSTIYLKKDDIYYRFFRVFFSKPGTYTWDAGINILHEKIYNYCRDIEPSTKNAESSLLNDPTIPTFDGKYSYTNDSDFESDGFQLNIKPMENTAYAIFCPEFELNQPYYNNIFTGSSFKYRTLTEPLKLSWDGKSRLFNFDSPEKITYGDDANGSSISVADGVSLVSLKQNYLGEEITDNNVWKNDGNVYFSSKAGTAQEVNFKFVGFPFLAYVNKGKVGTSFPFNLVRGIFGPYVGTGCNTDIANTIVNIYAPNYSNGKNDEIRALDTSAYQAISDRIEFKYEDKKLVQSPEICYRGDCYIGYFTHRVNRNFQDPTSPYNDVIIDSSSFKNGFAKCFDVETRTFDTTKEEAKYFNLGDINAVQLGSWVTFPVRSTMNICLRSVDKSYVDEALLCGNHRSFYPLHGIDASGSYKIPESEAFNVGYNKSGSEKQYYNITQLVYNKVYYKNRIVYSNVLQSSALTNGNRVFLSEHYKDYTDLYGEIIKLLNIQNNILCVCEHGMFLISVNERALAAEGAGGQVFINTSNVLPDNPRIISDTYGSQWVESIVGTPYGVYGVDEINKKIWYTNGETIKIISDFKVQEFLNNHLSVNNPLEIGQCNIRTHYIKYKNDVIFTLYDMKEDNLWNLCWNINEENWRTFYSWLPLDSQNLGNNLVSLDLLNPDYTLWKHGYSQSVPTSEYVKPTNWYGEQHPFEFEFVVKENPTIHKIFDNLQIIANKAEPESFHYEIVGECYDFAKLKETAYVRQEELKQLYSSIANISYNTNLPEVKYNSKNFGRAIMFPQYYARQDKKLLIYDNYKQMSEGSHDYNYLTGTELIRYRKLNEYRLCNHTKAVDVRKYGTLRGNMEYKEDKWDVQINPIYYLVSNEPELYWKNSKPPVVLDNIKLDEDSEITVPDELASRVIVPRWRISNIEEIAVKDKFIRIKVRYSGTELAVVSAVNTLYRLSYA